MLATAVGLGAIGYAAQASLYFSALRADGRLAAVPDPLHLPVLVTVAAVLLGRDRLTPGRAPPRWWPRPAERCWSCSAPAGSTFHPLGALLAFGAALTYTVYILVADTVVHRLPPVVLSTLVMTGAAGTLGVRALVTGGVDLGFGLPGWFWLACIAVVSTVVAMLAFFAGLKRTGPSTAAILSTFEPVVTTALAALTLGEILSPVQLAGGLLVLSLGGRPAAATQTPRATRRCATPRAEPSRHLAARNSRSRSTRTRAPQDEVRPGLTPAVVTKENP